MPSIRAKKKVNVYSGSSLNMLTNERKITKLLPLPMLHTVRLSQFIGTNAYFAKGESPKERLSAVTSANFRSSPVSSQCPSPSCWRVWSDFRGGKVLSGMFAFFPKSAEKTRSPARCETVCTYLVVRCAGVCSGKRSSYWPATCLGKVFCCSREGRDWNWGDKQSAVHS